MLAVGSLQTQLPLSSRCHLRGTRHSRHGTRPWPTFLATHSPAPRPPRQGSGRTREGAARTGRFQGTRCRAVAAALRAVSPPPASGTRLGCAFVALPSERHTPFPTHRNAHARTGGQRVWKPLSRSHARRDRIATPPLAEGPLRGHRFPHAPLSSASADAHCPQPEQRPGIAAGAPCSRPGSGCPRQDLGDRNRRPKTPGAATLIAQTRRAAGVSPGDVPGAPGPVTPGRELPTRLRLKPKKLHFATRSPGV